jgi:hypothetical protein
MGCELFCGTLLAGAIGLLQFAVRRSDPPEPPGPPPGSQ